MPKLIKKILSSLLLVLALYASMALAIALDRMDERGLVDALVYFALDGDFMLLKFCLAFMFVFALAGYFLADYLMSLMSDSDKFLYVLFVTGSLGLIFWCWLVPLESDGIFSLLGLSIGSSVGALMSLLNGIFWSRGDLAIGERSRNGRRL